MAGMLGAFVSYEGGWLRIGPAWASAGGSILGLGLKTAVNWAIPAIAGNHSLESRSWIMERYQCCAPATLFSCGFLHGMV